MMEVPHSDLLKKLEGRKDRKGYIQIMTEGQMSVSDYFIPSTYKDASGKENKCYAVTKLGCDFLANKSTGEKGVLFTARYVKRFYEDGTHRAAENIRNQSTTSVRSLPSIRKWTGVWRNRVRHRGRYVKPSKMVSEQFGIRLPDDFVKIPDYEQMKLPM